VNEAGTSLLAQLGQVADRVEIERRLEFESLPAGWSAVGGLLLIAMALWAVVWMYRREGRTGASLRVRMVLAALRCLVLLALAAIWVEPVLAAYLTHRIESYCLVLVDDSASMDLQDRYGDPRLRDRVAAVLGDPPTGPVRRSHLVERLLSKEDSRFLRELTGRNRVSIFAFADSLRPAGVLEARREKSDQGALQLVQAEGEGRPDSAQRRFDIRESLSFPARGSATRVAHCLRQAVQSVRSQGGSPIAGVVILSDGGFTEANAVESAAAIARDYHLPLHLVGVGDPAEPQNVRVVEVSGPESAFQGDPFAITAHLTATGLAGEMLEVELFERPADGAEEAVKIDSRGVSVADDGAVPPVTFTRRRERVGRWVYRAAVPLGAYESVADDNTGQVTVNVVDSRMRVLLVSGGPSWEYRYLSRLLERDDAFDVSCWLQSADLNAVRDGNTVIDRLPTTARELFQYDAVLLLDPDPNELTRDWCDLVGRLVAEYGGGVLYSAARKNTPALFRREAAQPLLKLLPVAPDPQADLILNRIGHYQQRPSGVVVPEASRGHPVLRSESGGFDPIWQRVGDIYWHYPVLREKPVAGVLMRHGGPGMANSYGNHVLAATQFVGAGRSAFVAFDGTWRWRRHGEGVFNRFWVRMLRYLVEGKLLGAQKRGLILTEADSYPLGTAVMVQARVYDERFEPLETDRVQVSAAVAGSKREFSLAAVPDRPGWFEGRFVPDRTGSWEITLRVPAGGPGSEEVTVRREIQVQRPNVEILRPQMNRDALMSLAASVEGGRYYEIDETDDVPEAIPDRHESTTVRSRPTPLWDRGWVLAGLVGLLCLEWAGRRWVRLL
jgi:hypothetical protein